MAGEWAKVQLRNLCVKIGSGATPRGGKGAYKGGSTSLIRSQNIYNDGFHRSGLVHIDDNQAAELRNVEIKEDDVLLNITGDSVARCCQVAEDVLPARVNQHVAIIRPRSESLDAQFLRYVLVTGEFQSHLLTLASAGATRPALTKTMIETLEIPLPPLPTQRAIASVLGTLDDLIELNRETNEILEEMARALFKSWFVDFDPVRAKLEGRPPAGMDAETAKLFPDQFQDSELGEIPRGWEVGVLDDLTGLVIGGDWGASEPTDEESVSCFCIRGADIPSLQGGGVGKMPIRFLKASSVEKRQLLDNDLALEISGGSPTQCTGRPVLISNDLIKSLGRPIVASNFCRILKLKSPVYSKFVYLWLRWLYDSGELFQFETGTTGIKNFAYVLFAKKYPLVMPDLRVINAFDSAVSPYLKVLHINAAESRDLATLRDTLLPKLLSGEVSAPAVEELIAAST